VPDWWLGPKDEYESLVKGAKQEGHLVLWSHPDPSCTPLIADVLSGEILLATFQGDSVEYQIRVGEQECRVKSDGLKEFAKRRQVFLHLPPERCLVIEKRVI
jgi:hypothetical protein